MTNELGQRLVRAREAAGLTQEELAHAVYRSRSSIANIEAGRQTPPATVLAGLARACGIPADKLLGSLPAPAPPPPPRPPRPTIRVGDCVRRRCEHCRDTTVHVGTVGATCLQCLADGGTCCSLRGYNRWSGTTPASA